MRMPRWSTAVIATLLLVGATAPSAWSADSGTENDGTVALLAVVNASGGSFAPDADGRGSLVLKGVDRATWFTDRPARRAGVFSIDALGAVFFDDQEPPNAALQVLGDVDVDHDVVILTISDPDYDATTGTLTYDAVVLPIEGVEADTALIDQVERADPSVPTTFGRAVLFIDSAADEFKAKCLSDRGQLIEVRRDWHRCRWFHADIPYRNVRALDEVYRPLCPSGRERWHYSSSDYSVECFR